MHMEWQVRSDEIGLDESWASGGYEAEGGGTSGISIME
jgi:hypothetical protein